MGSGAIPVGNRACADCGAQLTPDALCCPSCHSLTRASELEALSVQAQAAAQRGDLYASRALWEQCASLLPSDTVQYRSIRARIDQIDSQMRSASPSGAAKWGKRGATALGPIGLLLWKFKAFALILFT